MDQQPHLFSNIPFLALPIMAVIVVVVGVAIATKDLDEEPPLPPTAVDPTATPIVVVPQNCMVIQEEPLFVIMQCQKSTNFHY